ncbi:unnamed protein product [Ectocarpus sp. 4 AP-2014]
MRRHKLPDNWQEDTRFDGPEHWGMEERWKSLFPKTGFKTKSSGGIGDSSRDKDGGRTRAKGTSKATVDMMDMTAEGDDDAVTCSLQSGDDTDHFANFKQPSRAARRTVPETAPEDPEEEMPLSSNRRPNANNTENSGSSVNTSSVGKAPWDEEPTKGQRRWRIQPKSTEPASSSRAVHRARDSVLLPSSSEEEEEEEFDESEANITGHERNSSRSPIPRPRERKNGEGADESPPYPPPNSNKKGKGSRCFPGGGAAAFPHGDDSPSRQRQEEEIESSGSESCGGLSNSDFDGSEGEGRKPPSSSRRLSPSSPLSRRRKGDGEGVGTRRANGGGTKGKGRVVREGGRRRKGSSSHSRMSSNTLSSPIPGSAQGTRARSAPSGSKKARKVVRAQGNEQGWIAKGGGTGGGGSSGGRVKNPVLSFQGSQISMRKNNERSLTQSKINFPVVL